jgi:tetratricopeptide (TPR) repeat protein
MAEPGEWVVLSLDEKMARRHGMPAQMPMPKDKFEELGVQGLTHEVAQQYVKKFLGVAAQQLKKQQPETAKRYEAYMAKMPFWQDAHKAFEKGDFPSAIKQLALVCNVDKEDYAAKQNLATAYAAVGRNEDAVKLFKEIAEVWSGAAEYHAAYANVLMVGGNREEALEQYVSALEADPACQPAMDGLVSLGFLVKLYEDPLNAASLVFVRKDSIAQYLTEQWAANSELPVEHFLRVAGYHEEESRFDVMLAAAEHAFAKDPQRLESIVAKARALRRLDRLEDAKGFLVEKIAQFPNSATLLAELAQCERGLKNLDAAKECVDKALKLEPGHLPSLQLLFLPEGNDQLEVVQKALPAVRAFAEAHPDVAGAWRMLGRLSARAEDGEGSDAAFGKALALAPEDDDMRVEYWNSLVRRGEFQKLLDQAAVIENIGTKDWRLRWCEADAYHGLGKKMEARAAFTAINADTSLQVAVRARAKRAVEQMARGL